MDKHRGSFRCKWFSSS